MEKNLSGLAEIGEFGLIATLASKLPRTGKDVFLGIGDDTAAVDIGDGRLLLATCDIQIENIHFTIQGFTPEQIGWKAAAVNLSDIAAMGGIPRFALVSIAVPAGVETDYLVQVYQGLGDCFSKWGVSVIGGNTAKSTGGLILDITVLGEVEKPRILTRDGAKPGDLLCVTGSLGASRAGLALLSDIKSVVSAAATAEALARHRTPMPRLAEIRVPLVGNAVSACIDISDGLQGDAAHLAAQSGVQVIIHLDRLPVAACAIEVAGLRGDDPAYFALKGGEDFELLMAVRRETVDALQTEIWEKTGTSLTIIGEIVEGEGVQVQQKQGLLKMSGEGFDHFR